MMRKTPIHFVIEMYRGDLATRKLQFCTDDGSALDDVLELDDIYFTVKKRDEDSVFLFQKRLSTGGIVLLDEEYNEYLLRIEPEDTNKLAFEKEYPCDIEIKKEDQILQTFKGKMTLWKETTTARDEL